MDEIKCKGCQKRDVCKYKEQFETDYKNVKNAITFPDDFTGDLSCKYYLSFPSVPWR